MAVEIGALYKHFKKGTIYKVLAIAKHSETGEELVIYQNTTDESKVWARPISMWSEMVVDPQGNKVERFKKISE